MNPLSPIGALAVTTLMVGCAATSPPAPLPPDHPANPQAAAAPTTARSTTLAITPVGSAPASSRDTAATQPATAYTCPHHPDVRQATPGTCPKCKMKLEPEEPAEAAAPARPADAPRAHDHSEHQDHGGHNK